MSCVGESQTPPCNAQHAHTAAVSLGGAQKSAALPQGRQPVAQPPRSMLGRPALRPEQQQVFVVLLHTAERKHSSCVPHKSKPRTAKSKSGLQALRNEISRAVTGTATCSLQDSRAMPAQFSHHNSAHEQKPSVSSRPCTLLNQPQCQWHQSLSVLRGQRQVSINP